MRVNTTSRVMAVAVFVGLVGGGGEGGEAGEAGEAGRCLACTHDMMLVDRKVVHSADAQRVGYLWVSVLQQCCSGVMASVP